MSTIISSSHIEDPDGFFSSVSDVATAPDSAPGSSILDAPEDEATRILDEVTADEPKVEKTPAETEAGKAALAALDNELSEEEDPLATSEGSGAGRRKIDKSAMVDAAKKLIADGVLAPFADEVDEAGVVTKKAKALEDYTTNDFVSLIKDNLAEQKEQLDEQARTELFEALPSQMQYALKYFQDGGTDAIGLFRALGEVEQTRALDITKPADQEQIVRQYLQAKNFGSAEDIDDQIADYKQANSLSKWAEKHKPELDKMDNERVQQTLARQEQAKKDAIERRNGFVKNVVDVLKDSKLGDTKIDTARRDFLYNGLTQNTHKLANGQPTNLLGYSLQRAQFGEHANYDLLAQATWLLHDPKSFHEHFAKAAASQVALETAQKLKQTQSGKNGAASGDESADSGSVTTRRPIRRRSILNGEPL